MTSSTSSGKTATEWKGQGGNNTPPREPAPQPVGNQPGGPSGAGIDFAEGSRGSRSGLNLEQERAIGAPQRPIRAEDAGQLPDSVRDAPAKPQPVEDDESGTGEEDPGAELDNIEQTTTRP